MTTLKRYQITIFRWRRTWDV